jgi:hypothetical protein
MAVAIEDAGFEIRDSIHWVYGSGFPKSLDVSKAIDKMDAKDEQQARRYRFTAWVRSTGITAKQIDEATETMMGSHYTTHPTQPAIMTREHLESCRHLLGDIPKWVETECDIRSIKSKNFATREVVGKLQWSNSVQHFTPGEDHTKRVNLEITAPATEAAKQWQGWGTALKPAHEPIVLARKPLTGTVAQNVQEHGTGAINIDGCRIGNETVGWQGSGRNGESPTAGASNGGQQGGYNYKGGEARPVAGRWPANIIFDEAAGAELDEQSDMETSRFFYCPKPGKKERNAGGDNKHPTVKPVELMRYLCRLITPPGGTVLDPFLGSGTTAVAATLEKFDWVGCEMTKDYLPIIKGRVNWAQKQQQKLPGT